MKQKSKTSCIIPFWNEDQRLYVVLDEIIKCKSLLEIICVDDASDKDRSDEIRKFYPSIKLIRLDKNVGKTGAIYEGLKHSKGDFMLLLDADLRNLNYIEIDEAVSAMEQTTDIDMLILRRIKAPFFVKLNRGDVLTTGERILKKVDLEKILNSSINGWQIESAINIYMYKSKKKVFWMPHSGINTHWKWGLLTDLKYHRKKLADIAFIRFINLLKLTLFFARKELKIRNEKNLPPNRANLGVPLKAERKT